MGLGACQPRRVKSPGGAGRGGLMLSLMGLALWLWAVAAAGAGGAGLFWTEVGRRVLGHLQGAEAAALRGACSGAGTAAAPFRRSLQCRYGPAGRAPSPPLRPTELAELFLGAVILMPPRLAVGVALLVAHTVICVFCSWGMLGERGPRQVAPASGRYISFAILSLCGLRLSLERRGDRTEPAAVVVSNHCSYLDTFVLTYLYFPGFVAKAAVADVPLIGTIAKAMGSVFVERTADTKRAAAAGQKHGQGSVLQDRIQELDERMRADPSSSHKPLAVFAEGTTCNGEYVLPFKRGAFLAGVPVRPLAIIYKGGNLTAAWESVSASRHLLMLLSGFSSYTVQVIELPVIHPTEVEVADPALLAERTRQAIAEAGGFKFSTSTLKEKREYEKVMKSEMRDIKQRRRTGGAGRREGKAAKDS